MQKFWFLDFKMPKILIFTIKTAIFTIKTYFTSLKQTIFIKLLQSFLGIVVHLCDNESFDVNIWSKGVFIILPGI